MSGMTVSGGTGVQGSAIGAVELCETSGRALKLQTDAPHLVSLGGGRLSTAVTLHPIPPGRVTLGSGPNVDIPVQGTGVQPVHCHIENSSGVVTLYPLAEQISVDGIRVTNPTRLAQGVMLTIGRSNYMRFNHPAEAKLMKSVLPNSRISMAPMTFEPQENYPTKLNKKPPVAPRRSPRDSYSDSSLDESSCIMSKVSKFEYLAAQNALKSVSPKVFAANSVTVNTPAKDVLGKAPPNLQSFAKNLPQAAINYAESVQHNDKNHCSKSKAPDRPVFGRKSPSHYVNVTLNDTAKNCNNRVLIHENGCVPKHQNAYVNVAIDTDRHRLAELNNLNNKNLTGSSNSLKNIGVNNFGNNRIATPSPSFNRNPSPYYRSVTPSPVPLEQRAGSMGELTKPPNVRGVSGSIEDLTYRNNEAEFRRHQNVKSTYAETRQTGPVSCTLHRVQAYAERIKEQEDEKAEQARLEEILNMCAEYEKQVQWEKNNKPTPNRIKTNGSLPRDKRQCTSPTQAGGDESMFVFEVTDRSPKDLSTKHWNNMAHYENVVITHSPPVNSTPKSERTTNFQYENVDIPNLDCASPYENVVLISSSNSATSSPYPQSPRNKIKTYLTSIKQSTPKEMNEHEQVEEEEDGEERHEVVPNEQDDSFGRKQLNHSHSSAKNDTIPLDDPNHDTNTPKKQPSVHKFILPMELDKTVSPEVKSAKDPNTDHQVERLRLEKLRNERKDILAMMVTVKRKMADIEIQEEELLRELELEKALLNGEHQAKQNELEEDEKLKEKLLARAKQIEIKMEECRITQTQHQEDCKKKLDNAMATVNRLESELSKMSKSSSTYPDLVDELSFAREQLDNERKAFEDLEFHHLEEEADWLASREEIQREILDLSQKIETRKTHMLELDAQKAETLNNTTQESRSLERQLLSCLRKLEEYRARLQLVDSELHTYSDRDSDNEMSSDSENEKQRIVHSKFDMKSKKLLHDTCATGRDKPKTRGSEPNPNKSIDDSFIMTQSFNERTHKHISKKSDEVFNMSQSFNEKMLQDKSILDLDGSVGTKCPSQDDIDRISKVTSNAPINIEEGRGSLGRKTIESLKEIERNRQLHLVQQGSQVIEQERRRVLALKQRAQDEVRTQWAQNRHKDCTSLNSTGSEETQLDSVSGSDETDKRNSNITTTINVMDQNQQDSLKMRSETESPDSPRPMSESSELSCDTGISTEGAYGTSPTGIPPNKRTTRPRLADKHRPLTRYLPIRSSDLDLRKHIETAGHQVELCPHVFLTSTTCKGFLHKMGSKLHGWSRRWFVFDRSKRTLAYYSDKNEKKSRGGAYFQAIEEVYIDHQNSVKSPNPQLTFIIKTHERSYHLMAPSPEAMRIWVDVVFTGAEGYQEFEHGT